jgi:hypothetical protein
MVSALFCNNLSLEDPFHFSISPASVIHDSLDEFISEHNPTLIEVF